MLRTLASTSSARGLVFTQRCIWDGMLAVVRVRIFHCNCKGMPGIGHFAMLFAIRSDLGFGSCHRGCGASSLAVFLRLPFDWHWILPYQLIFQSWVEVFVSLSKNMGNGGFYLLTNGKWWFGGISSAEVESLMGNTIVYMALCA